MRRRSGSWAEARNALAAAAAADRQAAAVDRDAAAADRQAAADDRDAAALLLHQAALLLEEAFADRQQAALSRHQAGLDRAAASTDELTGALRRRDGFPRLQHEIDRCRRSHAGLVIGFVDVDGMKTVNDSRGHQAGDALLREVAAGLRSVLRSYDVLVRFGGDEFIFSLVGAQMADAVARFDKMRSSLAHLNGSSVSAGFAELGSNDTLEALVARADADLYGRRALRNDRVGSAGRLDRVRLPLPAGLTVDPAPRPGAGVAGPVPAGGPDPADGGARVHAQQIGQDPRRELAGQVEQQRAAGGAGVDAVGGEAHTELVRPERAPRLGTDEQPPALP